jgi:integrase/recombinase XerD
VVVNRSAGQIIARGPATTAATHDIRKVALWLGHADIRATEVYLRMDPSEKLEAVEAVIPPELRRGRFKAPDALIASLLEDASLSLA